MNSSLSNITRHFGKLCDPRRAHLKKHLLIDIIALAICAVIAGAKDWQQVVTFARERQTWLATFLTLENGIPSHDTFERVFDRLSPNAFLSCFQKWIDALAEGIGLKRIAIDGKTLRGSRNNVKGWKPLHLVSAWATDAQLSLGQVATEEKSNEITAIPRLLELIDVSGALVTIDAMGCQKEIAKAIVQGGGDYLLVAKDNQPNLAADIANTFEKIELSGEKPDNLHTYETTEKGHGREEHRMYTILKNPIGIRDQDKWEKLSVIGKCVRTRTVQGKTSVETHTFIGSGDYTVMEYGVSLRGHWGIENNLHWQLDVTFREDQSRVQRRNGAENLAVLRRLALMLLKQHPTKMSIAGKQFRAALNTDFMEEIIAGGKKIDNV